MTEREILNAIRALKMGTLLYTEVWLLIIFGEDDVSPLGEAFKVLLHLFLWQ